MHRRAVRSRAFLVVAAAYMSWSLSPLVAQTVQYSSTYAPNDATSVGYVPSGVGYGWGGNPWRASRTPPAGEFGGYLYRSPDEFVNDRGPVYVPIAGAQFGMPVADASGHVSLADVPMWTDEWAARIIQNRAAAGLAVESLAPADTSPTPSHFRTRFETIDHPEDTDAPKQMTPMRRVPSPPIAVPSTVTPPVTPTPPSEPVVPAHPISAAPPTESPTTLVLTAPEAVKSLPAQAAVAETQSLVKTPDAVEHAPKAPVEASPAIESVEVAALPDKTPDSERVDADVRHAASQPLPETAFDVDAVEATPAATSAMTAAPTAAAAPGLTREDLNRATAAGISIGRGDKAFEQGEYDQAREEYRHAIEVAGDAPGIRIALGLSDYALGSFEAAAKSIRRGVSHSPELAKSDFRLQEVYGRAGDSDVHRRQLDAFVTQNPENADTLFLLGFVQYFSDQREAARTTFGAYRSIVPHDDLADPFIENVMDVRIDDAGL